MSSLCASTNPPPWPSLYISRSLSQDGIYLCSTYDAWRFTTLWTLIIYAAFYLSAAGYAFVVQAGAHTRGHSGPASEQTESAASQANAQANSSIASVRRVISSSVPEKRGVDGFVRGARRNWKVSLAVGVGYVVVGGAEAVLAGSLVGALLGTVYSAGGFRLSTWIPLVWAVINALFLVLSSFSIQERLI